MPESRRPTILDVAARAGVSKSLVSNVLRGVPTVSPARRDAVLRAAEELGYRPNAVARSLVQRRTRTMGVLVSNLHNPFFADVIDGLQAVAGRHGYTVLLVSGGRDAAVEAQTVDALLEQRVDGLVLLSPHLPSAQVARAAAAVPVVAVGRRYRDVRGADWVVSDDDAGTGLAVAHLVELGHRRIAHIGGGRRAGGRERSRGYRAAMTVAGLPLGPEVADDSFTTEEGGNAAARRLLDAPRRPTAVLAVNDLAAVGAMDAVEAAGLRVPADLSIVGYDNSALAGLRHVALTTVDQPRVEMGERAADLLLRRVDGHGGPARHVLLAPRLVVRATTAPPATG